jgi:hypothetical protein
LLDTIEVRVLGSKIILAILGNDAPGRRTDVGARLDRLPGFVFHDTPSSASKLNPVGAYWSNSPTDNLSAGDFCSIVVLKAAIKPFVDETNDSRNTFHPDRRSRQNNQRVHAWAPNGRHGRKVGRPRPHA